jgi:glycosyltransferase involved in cell wall biosynthesis
VKIIHIGQTIGGVDTYVRYLASYLDHNLFSNIIVNSKFDENKRFNFKGVKKEYQISLKRNINPFFDFVAIIEFILIVNKEKPNLIHCHSSKGGVIGRIVAFLFGIPSAYTPNAFSFLSSDNLFKRNTYLLYERIFKSFGNHLIACSPSEMFNGLKIAKYKKSKTHLWNNSIDFPKKKMKITPEFDFNYILTIGRPSYQKNLKELIQIFDLYIKNRNGHKTKLIILGVGHFSPLLEEVKQEIKKLELEDFITLINWMERSNVLQIIQNAIIYVSTARYEGLPYSIIESLAYGVPIVAYDSDGNRDLVLDGQNGYLIPFGEKEEFASKLSFLSNNQKIIDKMGQASKELFEEKFDINKNISDLQKIYFKITVNRSS